jgi:hypothetical protein
MTKQIALTPDQIADGWLLHDGGPCPVNLMAKVEVMFRSGEIRYKRRAQWWTAFDTVSKFAEHDLWQHQAPNHTNDIVAYKPERPDHD